MQVGVDEAGGVIRVSDRKVAEPTEVTTAASAIGRPFGVQPHRIVARRAHAPPAGKGRPPVRAYFETSVGRRQWRAEEAAKPSWSLPSDHGWNHTAEKSQVR